MKSVAVIAAKGLVFIFIHNIVCNFTLASSPLLFALCADYFGRRALATHFVVIMRLPNLTSAALPLAMVGFRKNPVIVPVVLIVTGLASAVLFLMAKPPQASSEKEIQIFRSN